MADAPYNQGKPRGEVISREMAAVMREKTDAERLQIGFSMWRFARDMMLAAVRAEHIGWTDEEVHREVAKRMSHGAVDVQMAPDGEFTLNNPVSKRCGSMRGIA